MTRPCALVLCALLAWLALPTYAAVLLASVDRTRLNEGETFQLTLETNDVTQFGKPDLSPLATDFEVHDTRQINHLATLAEDGPGTTRWVITLLPRSRGTLTLPALTLGELHSQPIVVQVLQAGSEPHDNLAPVFIDSRLEPSSAYVQAQVVLTLRVYHSVALYDDGSLSPLRVDDARVEQLGPARTYEKLINGVRHGVIETRYALYPQRSGDMLIPPVVFTATPAQTDATGSPHPGALARVASAQLTLNVRPRPALYPADQPWLPARSLSLSETWNPDSDQAQVGDSLTRTLTLKAEGLTSGQLPPLPVTEITGLRHYPDRPQLGNQYSERGVVGSRTEREALVPSQAGNLELPALEVVWWNTFEDHLEHTRLPARTLHVAEAANVPPGPAPGAPAVANPPRLWPWQVATGISLALAALGFTLWWRARTRPAVAKAAPAGPTPRELLEELKRACLTNEPQTTRQALDAWARQQPETLADMAARYAPLSEALDKLNGALYSEAGRYWQGAELWRAIGTIPASERASPRGGDSLPPLYPQ
ncbi:BatD family protein [Pseudomonas typographi]|uniref:Protein BatD n=1 Tax=Pseudomonas typographi TaxID=2715964 RepID=A0ABR7Z264_9PSED|nr:BatD family protein [Pseudomonas typographi]MBD1587263.1 protein BatD [Pseudomonas typographi]MBD1599580.1 protein BatD [Pseudomonas typographi]